MAQTTIYTIPLGARPRIVANDKIGEYKDEAVTKWTFDYKEPTIADEIEVGRKVAATGVFGQPPADVDTVLLVKGKAYYEQCVTGGPSLDAVPAGILRELGLRIPYGEAYTKEELDALKNDSSSLGQSS